MQKKFFLSKDGTQVGPYLPDQVLAFLKAGDHSWTDYLWDEFKKDWVMILEHPQFSEKFANGYAPHKKTEIPLSTEKSIARTMEEKLKEKAWYILKEGNNYGPFSRIEVVQMLQEKTLFEHDFIWKEDFAAWKHVSDVDEFKPSGIKALKDSGLHEVSEVFFRRRHLRAKYGCSVIVHNSKTVFRGSSVEISAGGAGVCLNTNLLLPGQNVFLHFKPGDGVPPFNATCLIVSRSTHYGEKNEPTYKYGFKFLNVASSVKDSIKEYTTQKAA